jgi:hypothetical protein
MKHPFFTGNHNSLRNERQPGNNQVAIEQSVMISETHIRDDKDHLYYKYGEGNHREIVANAFHKSGIFFFHIHFLKCLIADIVDLFELIQIDQYIHMFDMFDNATNKKNKE